MNLVRLISILWCVLFLGESGSGLLSGAGGEDHLLNKYQKKTQHDMEQLKAKLQEVLKKAKSLEGKNPEMALELVRDARDHLIGHHLFTLEEEKVIYKPLWNRMELLRRVVQQRREGKMEHDLSDNKESIVYWSDQLEKAQRTGVPAYKEATVGGPLVQTPGLIAFRNGTYSFCLLNIWPHKMVDCTVDGHKQIFLASEILGVKIPSGYYLFHDKLNQFVYVTNPQAFILTAPTRLSPGLPELPSPTPSSIIPKGSAAVKPETVDVYVKTVFTKGVHQVPMFFDKEKGFQGEVGAAMRAARDILIEAQMKTYLSRASEDTRTKFKRKIVNFLNGQPSSPLTERQQEDLLYEMRRAVPNSGRWPQLLLEFVNDLVQPNEAPRHE